MDEVYRSMDALLRERSFDRITIADLATHADVAVSYIYARFKDKNELLAGVYLNSAYQAENCLGPLAAPSLWRQRSDEQMVRSIVGAIDRFYRQHGHVLVAAVLGNVEQIEASRLRVWRAALDAFTGLLADRAPEADVAALRLAVQIALRFVTSVMHQTMAIGPVSRWEGRVAHKLLLDELARMVLDLVARAKAGTLKGE